MTNKSIRPNVVNVDPATREPLIEPEPGSESYPEQISHPGRINPNLPPRVDGPNQPSSAMWQDFHSNIGLNSDTNSGYVFTASWQPKFWIIKSQASAGYLLVHLGSSRGLHYVRMDTDKHTIRSGANSLTIETVGFTGFFDVYAVQNLDDFRLTS